MLSDAYTTKLFYFDTIEITVTPVESQILDGLGAHKLLITPDKKYAVIATMECVVYFYSIEKDEILAEFGFHAAQYEGNSDWKAATITSMAVSSDGKWLVTGDSKKRLASYCISKLEVIISFKKVSSATT